MKNVMKKLTSAALICGMALCGPMTMPRAGAWGWEDSKEVAEAAWDCVVSIAEHMPPPIIVDEPTIPPYIIIQEVWKTVDSIMK